MKNPYAKYRMTTYTLYQLGGKGYIKEKITIREDNPGAFNSQEIADKVEKKLKVKLMKMGFYPVDFFHLIDHIHVKLNDTAFITVNGGKN